MAKQPMTKPKAQPKPRVTPGTHPKGIAGGPCSRSVACPLRSAWSRVVCQPRVEHDTKKNKDPDPPPKKTWTNPCDQLPSDPKSPYGPRGLVQSAQGDLFECAFF